MANHASALKRHLQSVKKNARNRAARAALATQVKKARTEINEKKASPNQGEVKNAVSMLASSARKGILRKKTASRRISRLMKQANKNS
jgi:small subunit ribosomal protein S20